MEKLWHSQDCSNQMHGWERLTLQKSYSHPLVRALQRLRQDARLAEDGHEIGVACPTRDNMNMDMRLYPGARGFADVGAHVEGLRAINFAQDVHTLCCQFHHFGAGGQIEFLKIGLVVKRDDHEMS